MLQGASVMSFSVRLWGLLHGAPRLLCPWGSPGGNTAVGSWPPPGDRPNLGLFHLLRCQAGPLPLVRPAKPLRHD